MILTFENSTWGMCTLDQFVLIPNSLLNFCIVCLILEQFGLKHDLRTKNNDTKKSNKDPCCSEIGCGFLSPLCFPIRRVEFVWRSRETHDASETTLFLFHSTMKARDEFQELLADTSPPALSGEGPKHAGEAALPQWRHGSAAGCTNAAVPSRGRSPWKIIPILGHEALVICACLPAKGTPGWVLRHTGLVTVLAVYGHGAQPTLAAALTG